MTWVVGGGSGFSSFTRTIMGPYPATGGINSGSTVVRASGHTLSVDAVVSADSVLFAIGPVARTLAGNATACTFSAAELSSLAAGSALAQVVAATGAPAYAGTPDAGAITLATGVTCREVWTGDTIEVGPVRLEVIGLVGHTPGSITLALTPADGPVRLFTGDSLFPGGLGKTWKPADFDTLAAVLTSAAHPLREIDDQVSALIAQQDKQGSTAVSHHSQSD